MTIKEIKMNIFQSVDSPALVVYPDVVKANIAEMVRMAGVAERLRPHIKTHKTAEGIELMMDAGIRKFKCATIAEAELLAMCKAPDILLAHQPVGPKITRLLQLIQTYPTSSFSCITDNVDAAKDIGMVFHQQQLVIPVHVDVNAGMNRTGILPEEALELILQIQEIDGLSFAGLHVYDGQHRQADPAEREKACDAGFEPVNTLVERITNLGMPYPSIIAGGSPTYSIHARRPNRDCSPGTNIFWDRGYALICPEQSFTPAVHVVTRVISLPAPGRICLDLGHKAIAAENEITKRIYFPDYPDWKPVGQSEEHLVMEVGSHHGMKPGDIVIGIPYHICPTVALHETLHVVEDGNIAGEWKVLARKRKINI